MLALALVLALSGQAPQDTAEAIDPVTVEALKKRPSATLPDFEIERQLNALREAEPDRILCVKERPTDSFIARKKCATLRAWYDLEAGRDTAFTVSRMKRGDQSGNVPARPGPPSELVKLIKDRMDNSEARAQAASRARERLEARAQQN